jgi:hypothetical protein
MWTDVDKRPEIAASRFSRIEALAASPVNRLGTEMRRQPERLGTMGKDRHISQSHRSIAG